MHPRLSTLFSDFNQAGIRWCLLRLPHGTDRRSGDVDLLVDAAHLRPARRLLAEHDFTRLPGWKPEFHYLSYDPPSDQWLWLHLVSELAFGPLAPYQTGAEAACLDHRQPEGACCRLAGGDAFWELLLHCLLDKGQIALHHRPELQALAPLGSLPGPLASAIQAACPDGWTPEQIAGLAQAGRWAELEALIPALKTRWPRRSAPGKWLRKRLARRLIRLRSLPGSRGISVALLGPDGAGKSTLMAGLQDTFMLPVQTVYMGLTGGLLRYASRLRLPFLVIPARLFVFWGRYLRAFSYQMRGNLVVFDRYIYDYAVPTPYPLSRLERIYRWIDGHSCPAPDLVLILEAPGAVMYQRKGEYSPEMLEDWRAHFIALHDRLPQSEVIDTTCPAEQVRVTATASIWRRCASRWKEASHG